MTGWWFFRVLRFSPPIKLNASIVESDVKHYNVSASNECNVMYDKSITIFLVDFCPIESKRWKVYLLVKFIWTKWKLELQYILYFLDWQNELNNVLRYLHSCLVMQWQFYFYCYYNMLLKKHKQYEINVINSITTHAFWISSINDH